MSTTILPTDDAGRKVSNASGRSGWTDERVRRLEALWADGRTASETAAALDVSRNAVIGKVHRLGLCKDGRHAASRLRPTKSAAPREVAKPRRRPGRPRSAGALTTEALPGLTPRLDDLPVGGCRWPVGDPRSDDFAFCGRGAVRGPYCAVHAGQAYQAGPDGKANRFRAS